MHTQPVESHPAPWASLYGLYLISVTVSGAGNLLVRIGNEAGWLGRSGQVSIAVLAVLPMMVAAGMFWRLLRRDLDEMIQRIVLEGLAFAFLIYLPLAALFMNLRTAGAWVPRIDPADMLLSPALFVAIGITLAWRRLR